MQETKVLYTAKAGNNALNGFRIPRWVDALMFFGVLFILAGVLGRAMASGDPRALLFVKVAVGAMVVSIGVFVLMLLVNRAGLWGFLGLVPFGLVGVLWMTGIPAPIILQHLGQELFHGVIQVLKIGFYGFAGVAGLGLLARLIEKVGLWGFVITLAIAIGMSIWLIG